MESETSFQFHAKLKVKVVLYTLICRPSNRPQKYELNTEGHQLCQCKDRWSIRLMNWVVCVDRDEEGRAIHCLEQWLSTGVARHGVEYGIPHSYIHCIPLNANLITFRIHGISWSGIPNWPKNSVCVPELELKAPHRRRYYCWSIWPEWSHIEDRFPACARFFCLPHSVQTVFRVHPAYPVATDSSSAWPTGRAVKPSPRSSAGVKNGRSKRLPQTPINLHDTMYHSQMQLYLHVYPEDDGKTCTEALLSAYQTKRCHSPKHRNAKPRIHHFMLSQQTSALLLACNFKFVE